MMRTTVAVMALLAGLLIGCDRQPHAAATAGAEAEIDQELGVEEKLAIADAARPGFVQVAYTLQYDKGESPYFYGGTRSGVGASVIEQERPAETAGFLIDSTTVLTGDLVLHPRFIKSRAVRFGDDVVPATVSGYLVDHDAILLKLDRPLEGAEPFSFNAEADGPFQAVSYTMRAAEWTVRVSPFSPLTGRTVDGETFQLGPDNVLVVGADGTAVGIAVDSRLPADESWKGSPLAWEMVSEELMTQRLAELEQRANAALLRVALNFRSPKKSPGLSDYVSTGEVGTEQNVMGVLIAPARVLVLAQLQPKATRRLERVQVYPGDGRDSIEATFAGSLKDYGALVVELAEPLEGAVVLDTANVRERDNKLLMLAEIRVQGDNRVAYFLRNRINGFYKGWRQNIYPAIPGDEEDVFLLSADGTLVALPISHRPKPTAERQGENRRTTAGTQVAAVLTPEAFDEHCDANNIPLTEEEESRLAWMGVALQPLSRELARANNCADLTRDGRTGAIVSFVYEGSPAAEAGVEVGWILLRLDVEDEPKPLEVTAEAYVWENRPFPWEQWDDLPEMYYDEVPPPWSPAETAFTRALTDLGFGRKYTARFFVDGEIVEKAFEVVESPKHYESAPNFKFEPLGLTVKDLTYELRHYFRKTLDAPGVILSKIEPGSKASVSGLKPFEIITHVNDQPVVDVAEFERLVEGQAELRLDVLRMTRGRVVKVQVSDPSGPADDEIPALPDESTIDQMPSEEIPAIVP